MHKTTIATTDDFQLHATTFGDAQRARAGVVIASAMGVEQHYYAPFAQWLAQQGFWVVTFDYRGMGASRPAQYRRSLRGFEADVRTWAERDCAAVIDFADAHLADRPLLWIGHSLGGQVLGLVPNRARVRAMVTVAVGSGYWLENAPALRRYVWWLWYVAAPAAMRLFGYFPGRRLKKIGDLPLGVMRQWRAWCLDRDYVIGVEGPQAAQDYASVTAPILSLSFTDDEYMSARNTESLHGFYRAAQREMRRLDPREIGVPRIGHFGFFRRKFEATLWPQAGEWLMRHVQGQAAQA